MTDSNVPRFEKSGLSRESRPWGRQVENLLKQLVRDSSRSGNSDLNANKTQNSTMAELSNQIRAMPIPVAAYTSDTGFSLAATRYFQVTIPIPAGKTSMTLTAIANVAALDATSGGAAVASASIEVGGSGFLHSSPIVPASKDAGASAVNNLITPAMGFQQAGLIPGSNLSVALAVFATNGSAFPARSQNYATLTVSCIFFD